MTEFLHALPAADDLDRAADAGRHPDLTERARVRMDTSLVAKYARQAVELLVLAHGTSSVADHNPLQRIWRDVHVASHHAITEWQVNLEVYGKALLGVEPNITSDLAELLGLYGFGPRSLRALARRKRHTLSLPQLVEPRADAR